MVAVGGGGGSGGWVELVGGGRCELWTPGGGPWLSFRSKSLSIRDGGESRMGRVVCQGGREGVRWWWWVAVVG